MKNDKKLDLTDIEDSVIDLEEPISLLKLLSEELQDLEASSINIADAEQEGDLKQSTYGKAELVFSVRNRIKMMNALLNSSNNTLNKLHGVIEQYVKQN